MQFLLQNDMLHGFYSLKSVMDLDPGEKGTLRALADSLNFDVLMPPKTTKLP